MQDIGRRVRSDENGMHSSDAESRMQREQSMHANITQTSDNRKPGPETKGCESKGSEQEPER